MGIQHNMATVIRIVMQQRQMTLSEFSEELEVSRSSLQSYLREEGNPSIATVEHLASKLDMDPVALVSGEFGTDQSRLIIRMFEMIREVSELPDEKKQLFGEHMEAVINLWDPS